MGELGIRDCPICGNAVLGEGVYCPACTGRARALAERESITVDEALVQMRETIGSALSGGIDWGAALGPVYGGDSQFRTARGKQGGELLSAPLDPDSMSDEDFEQRRKELMAEADREGVEIDTVTQADRDFYGRQFDRTGRVELGDPKPVLGMEAIERRTPLHNRGPERKPNRRCVGSCEVWIRVDGPPGLRVLCPSCGGPMEEV